MNSEMKLPGFKSRLESIIGEEQPFSWASRIGIPSATFNRMWNEGVPPKANHLALIAKKTGYSIDWLLTGEGDVKRSEAIANIPEYTIGKDLGEDFVLVPRYEVMASAGGGAMVHSEQVVDHLAFRSEWVRNALDVSVKALALISVKGDSMEPTLSNGDLILVDTSTQKIDDNAIYVLRFNGSLLVKRIQRKFDGSVVIKSDNQAYDPEVITGGAIEELHIVGRVVWGGRRM